MNKPAAPKKTKTAGKSAKAKASPTGRSTAAATKAAAGGNAKAPAQAKEKVATAPAQPALSQAQRLLEAVRKARANQSGGDFARNIGKSTLARNARKTGKGEVGGSNV